MYDSLDKENAGTKNKNTDKILYANWQSYLVLVLIVLVLFFIIYLVHQQAWYLYESYEYRSLGMLLLVTIYGSFTLVLLGASIVILYYAWNKASRSRLINIMEHQLDISQLRDKTLEHAYYDIQGRRADKSIFAGVQNVTYNPAKTTHIEGTSAPIIEQALEEQDENIPMLEEMNQRGLIGRSGNSLLIGFTELDE